MFYGGDVFELVHENTEKRLKTTRYHQYSYMNWENCPFDGQMEVCAIAGQTRETEWRVVGGVFFKEPAVKAETTDDRQEDEL